MFGTEIPTSVYCPKRSVIGEVSNAPGGNVVLRVGREVEGNPPVGWETTEHVVLTPIEAVRFVAEVVARADEGLKMQLGLRGHLATIRDSEASPEEVGAAVDALAPLAFVDEAGRPLPSPTITPDDARDDLRDIETLAQEAEDRMDEDEDIDRRHEGR